MATPVALFPPEILEEIFKNLDGVSLLRCEQVCSTWKDVIQSCTKLKNTWKTCCEREISKDVLLEIINNRYPSGIYDKESVDWKTVYKCWYQWQSLSRWRFVARYVFTAENRRESITCLRMSGNCIITGHPSGSIKLWDRYKCFVGEICSHKRDVTDLDLMKFDNFSVGCDEWNLKHNLVISTSIDRSVQVSCITVGTSEVANITIHTAPTIMVRTYLKMFVVLSKDSKISVWSVDGMYPLSATLLHLFTMREQPECIDFSRGEFTGFSVSGVMFQLECSDDLVLYDPHRLYSRVGRMKKGFCWRNEIIAWLSTENYLHIYLNDSSEISINTMSFLMSYPVTLLLYANIFFMGLESGEVVMYYVNSQRKLIDLDFTQYRQKIKLSRDPIVLLDVQEMERGPCVVAATSNSLFCISFIVDENLQ